MCKPPLQVAVALRTPGSPLAAASPQGPHVSLSPVPKPFLLPALCLVLLKPELWPGQVLGSAAGPQRGLLGDGGFAPVAVGMKGTKVFNKKQ